MMPALAAIGFGAMNGAVIRGAIASGVLSSSDVLVIDPSAQTLARAAALGCSVAPDASAVHRQSVAPGALLFGVRPGQFAAAAAAVGRLAHPSLVLSVMAGITADAMRQTLGTNARVVRAMPNLPACVGAGMTVLARDPSATDEDAALARRLFQSVGAVLEAPESMLDSAVAVCGSGPAYAFALAEAWVAGAVRLGWSHEDALRLVQHTLHGAALMLMEPGADPAQLRAEVVTKGGTTAAALAVWADRDLAQTVADGMTAARDRAAELGSRSPGG